MPKLNVIKICFEFPDMSCNSVVSIVTRLQTVRSRVRIPAGEKWFISSPKRADRLWSPSNLLFNGYWKLFLSGVK